MQDVVYLYIIFRNISKGGSWLKGERKNKENPFLTGVQGGPSGLQTDPDEGPARRETTCFSQLSSPVLASTPASSHTGGGPVGITLGLNCPATVVNVQTA